MTLVLTLAATVQSILTSGSKEIVVDQPGEVVFDFTNTRVRADLTDADGIVSVQVVTFTNPDGDQIVSNASERTQSPGTWRSNIRNNARGEWSVVFTYTDSLGAGKTARATATR